MPNPEEVIKSIRESFGSSISVYRLGNCYQFYEILKTIFPEAEAHYDGNHVWTKIGDSYYDIRGLMPFSRNLKLIDEPSQIESLSRNKWSDERRNSLKNQGSL